LITPSLSTFLYNKKGKRERGCDKKWGKKEGGEERRGGGE